MNLREYLKHNKIITDGAFGTYYQEKFSTDEIPELANTFAPEKVIAIHSEYISAGAKLIRTNTFASNTAFISGGIDAVKENIRQAVHCAKSAVKNANQEIFIAGDIGPIPQDSTEHDFDEYYEISKTFIEEGITILNFETFPDIEEILPAIRKIRQDNNDIFTAVQFSVNQFGYSASGQSAKKLIAEASGVAETDATGLNCGVGPSHMEKILSTVNLSNGKYIFSMPNASYPNRIRNQIKFSDNADYFALKVADLVSLGADAVGGCCGTTPKFIEKLKTLADLTQTEKTVITESKDKQTTRKLNNAFFTNSDGTEKGKKLIAVELAPPLNTDDEKLLYAAKYLSERDVDVLTFPDSPSGRTRIDSVLMAQKVKNETGMCVMPHICCRDKNAIAMRSMFLGAHINGIDNALIITGDPIPTTARQTIKSVFNFDSVGLMKIASEMNEDTFTDSPFIYGGAINQGKLRIDNEIKRVKKKMSAGATFFMTQPVFSEEDAERIRRIKEETGARILVGIMPLISRKNAMFMKNEIAGVNVTDEVIEMYKPDFNRQQGEQTGINLARKIISYTEDFADGYYFTFPFNRVHMLDEILK